MGGGSRRRGNDGGFDPYYDGRPLGPVEELYDDIYDDLSGPGDNSDLPPIFKLFGGGGGRGRSSYGSGRRGGGGGGRGIDGPTSKLNIGIPKRTYLKVTNLNSKYDSYRYSLIEATRGRAIAASELRKRGFEDALWRALGVSSSSSSSYPSGGGVGIASGLSPAEGTALLTLERDFLSCGAELIREVGAMNRAITNAAILMEMDEMGIEAGSLDAIIDAEMIDDAGRAASAVALTDAQKDFFAAGVNTTAAGITTTMTTTVTKDEKHGGGDKKRVRSTKIEKKSDLMRAIREVESINTEILMLELDFVRSIIDILGPDRADAIRTTIVGNTIGGEAGTLLRTLRDRPLSSVLSSLNGRDNGAIVDGYRRKNLYVTRFPGDVTASQLNELREEVTGILRSARPGDEALLVLQSGGGTVTGYGLAAAQLQRFKAKGMKLTVCVEQVAASGGYMMCCTADRIVASPFAVLGSIGVISEIPNAYERLQREGIEFQTITAGKFKRTVTPTKKVTKEDIKKSTEDITEIFNLFKGFVKSQRPQLDIENVATGETWFGEDALERGLCDELGTADDVLLDYIDNGYDVYEVSLSVRYTRNVCFKLRDIRILTIFSLHMFFSCNKNQVAYTPAPMGMGLLAGLPGGSSGRSDEAAVGASGWRGVLRSLVKGMVSDVKEEVVAELTSALNTANSVERRYMAKDDSADRIQMKD
jgi:signal peptide peptidase SppA